MLKEVEQKFLDDTYKLINKKIKYGDYKKCEFHIHTPESRCYRFLTAEEDLNNDNENDNDTNKKNMYSKMSVIDVLEYAKSINYISQEVFDEILNNLSAYESQPYVKKLSAKEVSFRSFKEYLTYSLIAHKLFLEKVEVAVISDHNTISGYDKLLFVIEEYYKIRMSKKELMKPIKLFLGVEISCSDKNHLVVIVDEIMKNKLKEYLSSIIMGDNLGTYLDTRIVINEVQKLKAITYIAHANSSDFYGNDVYKREMLNLHKLHGLGIKDVNHKKALINKLSSFNSNIKNTSFILEADSHSLNQIGLKNCWIKLSKMNFNALKKAFLNHSTCISNERPVKTSKQIKGLIIEKGDYGFLGPNEKDVLKEKYMIIDFSRDLNCIIGGKGTGKSTILNIIEVIYSQEVDDINTLDFISRHKRIYSLFVLDDNEYLLDFIPQTIKRGLYNTIPTVNKNSYYKMSNGIYKLGMSWYRLFKITKKGENNIYTKIKASEVSDILNHIFKRGYNINKLITKISNDKISDYIREIMGNNVKSDDINKYIMDIKKVKLNSLFKFVREQADDILCMIENRKDLIQHKIDEFNIKNSGILIIKYKPLNNYDKYIEQFLNILSMNSEDNIYKFRNELNKSVCKTYLTWGDIQKYLFDVTEKIGYFEMLKNLLNNNLNTLNKELPLKDYESIDSTYKSINFDLKHVDNKIIKEINSAILQKLANNKELFRSSMINCFEVLDNFEIYFNINHKEDTRNLPVEFKNIKILSMGQKVAALLTLVFNFGVITNDNTPLIIDQPEDNLDNTYIYKNLVESLKVIKNTRQVIIVTHSSTIVINADSEQVIVLKSNSNNAWIEKQGYPSEKSVTNHILNYLEGGKASFTHKYNMYKTIIRDLNN